MPPLLQALSDADSGVRWAAAVALGELGDSASVSPLIQALSDAGSSVRRTVASTLGELGDLAAVPPLIQALSDADHSVRWLAAKALGKLGDPVAVPPLIQALSDLNWFVRRMAAEALSEILASKNLFDARLLQKWANRLVKFAYHRDEDIREQAVRVLERVALRLAITAPAQAPASTFDACA